jgi:O-antigen ligase
VRLYWRAPPALLLLAWLAAVFAGGLRGDISWLAGSSLFWLLVAWSPPDGQTLARMNLWWAWAGWVLLSSLASTEPAASLYVWCQKTTILFFFALAWAWWGPRERKAWLFSMYGSALVLVGACVWGARHGWPDGGLLPPNPNYTACFAAAAASASIWSAADGERSRASRFAYAALAAVLALAAFWLRSRGALLAIAGSAALWAVFNRNIKLPALGLVGGLALFAWLPTGSVHGLLKLDDPLAYERPRLWSTALDIAADNPWLGVGPGCFEKGYFKHRKAVATDWTRFSRYTTHAHSEPLHLAAETGWLGLGFLAWAMAFFLPSIRPASPLTRSAAGAFWAVLIHSLVDGVMALPAVELLFFCSLACASDIASPPFRFGPRSWRWLGLGAAGITLAAWLPVHRASQWRERLAGSMPTERRIALLKDALAVHPADSYVRDRLAAVYLMEAPGRPALALWQLDEAIRYNPSNALFWDQKSELLLRIGDPAAARAAAVHASALEPNFVSAQVALGEADLALKRVDEARTALLRIDEIRGSLKEVKPTSEYERLLLTVPMPRYSALKAALEE